MRPLQPRRGPGHHLVMTTTQNTAATRAKLSWIRRLTAGAVLAATPAIIALGTAGVGHADSTINNPGPSMSSPAQHQAFPHQTNAPQPGTSIHHHHQNRHG